MSRELRDSGVGWLGPVPADWGTVPAQALFGERKAKSTASDVHLTPSQKYGVLPQEEYMQITGNKVVLNLTGVDNMRHVEAGDYVSHLRSFQGGLEYAGIPGKVSAAYTVLKPKVALDSRFFRYLFKSDLYVQALQTTTDQLRDGQSIRYPQFSQIPLPQPSLHEQRVIADYLDRETAQIDAFIAKNEDLIALLSERRMALVMELVSRGLDRSRATKDSGVPWLGVIPEHWDTVRARYLCSIATGDGDTVDAVDDGEFPFYVRSDTPQRSDRHGYDLEAVLTSGDGAGVGKVFHLVEGRFAAHQRVYVMHHFKRVSAAFFYRFFAAYFGVVALDGSAKSTVDSVRRHMITNMPIAVPPAEEQEAIVAVIEKRTAAIDEALATAQASISLAKERRAALISTAVTGRLDVGATVA